MAANTSSDICVVRGESGGVGGQGGDSKQCWTLGAKGYQTFIETSKKHGDELYLACSSSDKHYVHDSCYRTYTSLKNIIKSQKSQSTKSEQTSSTSSLRSNKRPYDYPSHCLICAEELDFENALRHPSPQTQISSVEVINKEKKSLIQESLLSVCEKRQDVVAVNVKSRILFAGDIRAVEAKYHRKYMQKFMSQQGGTSAKSPSGINICNINLMNNEAFKTVCQWLLMPEQQHCQFSLTDIRDHLVSHLPLYVPSYSTRHIKRRLLEYFGDQVTISELDGKVSVVALKDTAVSILHESYTQCAQDSEDDETIKVAKQVASSIKQDISDIDHKTDVYPSPADIDLDNLEDIVPESLQYLMKTMFTDSHSETGKRKQRLKQTSLSHVLMHAVGKKSFMSPLLLLIDLLIHQTTYSRVLLDVLSTLGLSVPYDQVIAFERSAAVEQSVSDVPPGLSANTNNGGFCQWIADNFYYNEDTVTGSDSTYTMGIIACQTPAGKNTEFTRIKRRPVTAENLLRTGEFGLLMKEFIQVSLTWRLHHQSCCSSSNAHAKVPEICALLVTVPKKDCLVAFTANVKECAKMACRDFRKIPVGITLLINA